MQHVSAKYKEPSSGGNRVSNKSYHANYLNSLFVSVYTVDIRTSIWLLLGTDVNTESSRKIYVWELGSVLRICGGIKSIAFFTVQVFPFEFVLNLLQLLLMACISTTRSVALKCH